MNSAAPQLRGDRPGHEVAEAKPLVVAVVLNCERPVLTIECLNSLRTCDYPNLVVIVVNNGSPKESHFQISAWAKTFSVACESVDDLDRPTILNGHPDPRSTAPFADVWSTYWWLYIINSENNHGFAGGNNLGIRAALLNKSVEYVWLLNNDTVVVSDCLTRMVERFDLAPTAGICGSRLLNYEKPEQVQALGGATFCVLTGNGRSIGEGKDVTASTDSEKVEKSLDYVIGASMLVRRRFIETVGLMEEGYFFYYEEIDWITRAGGRFSLAYADRADVYHRGGATLGTNRDMGQSSRRAAYYIISSRIKFTKRFYPWALPGVVCFCVCKMGWAFCRGYTKQGMAMFAALTGRDLKGD